jgi:hypothetical protein
MFTKRVHDVELDFRQRNGSNENATQQVPFDIPVKDAALTMVPEEAIRERA